MNRSGVGWLTEATSADCIASSKFYLYYCFCLGDYPLVQVKKYIFKCLVVLYKHLSGALLSVYPRVSNSRWIPWQIKTKSDPLRLAFGPLIYNFQIILTLLGNENTSVLKKKSPGGLDCKMTHECLLNGGTWYKKMSETFLCIKYWRIWLVAVMFGRKTQQMSTATLDVLKGNKTDCMRLASTSTEKGKNSWLFEPSYSYPFIFPQLLFWKTVIKVIRIKFYQLNERT